MLDSIREGMDGVNLQFLVGVSTGLVVSPGRLPSVLLADTAPNNPCLSARHIRELQSLL
jgi:hypothetical protein